MMKTNLKDLVITRIVDADFYYSKCPKCGYINLPEYLVKVCPICKTDLHCGHLENIEC